MRSIIRKCSRMAWSDIIALDICAFFVLFCVLYLNWHSAAAARQEVQAKTFANSKRIAFSFDDVPRGSGAFLPLEQRPQILIEALKAGGIKQAVFFINPGRISASDKDAATVAAYTAAGHVIANHTANHIPLSSVSAEAFLADVDAAERWLKPQRNYRPWLRGIPCVLD